jgi:hypothetical protein
MESANGLSDLLCESPNSPFDRRIEPLSAESLPSGLRDMEACDASGRRLRQRIDYIEFEASAEALDIAESGLADSLVLNPEPVHESRDGADEELFYDECSEAEAGGIVDQEFLVSVGTEDAMPDGDVDSGVFNELYAAVIPSKVEDCTKNLLSHESIQACLSTKCGCSMPCTVRANLDHFYVYKLRIDTIQHSLHDGARTEYIADTLRHSYNPIARHHPAETERGSRIPGQRARRQHYVINNVDVCPMIFALSNGISTHLLRASTTRAKGLSRAKNERTRPAFLAEAIDLDSDIESLHVVQFVLDYAQESGAEKIPMDEDLERAARFQKVHGSIDGFSLLRLHECTAQAVYDKYVEGSDSGRRYEAVDLRKFREIFKDDKRLLHICLARRREDFSICTNCQDAKTQLAQQHITKEQRVAIQQNWALHLHLVWRERLAYTKKAHAPFLEKSESIPPIIRIRIALSLHIDKQTKNMTG